MTPAYRERYEKKRRSHDRNVANYATAEDAAQSILEAAEDGTWRLRYPAAEAKAVALGRRLLGDEGLWKRLCKKFV